MDLRDLSVVIVPIDQVRPDPANPRTHTKAQVQQIVTAMREFGWTAPILVDEDNQVLAGHGRLEAAKAMGLERIPTICIAGLDEAQRRAYVIADNQIALNAGWDRALLRTSVMELMRLDFDLKPLALTPAQLYDLNPQGEAQQDHGSLARTFGAPPFTVLDARQGYWRDRKLAWLQRGIVAQDGREYLPSTVASNDAINRGQIGGSSFDPVLVELMVRWFCPPGGQVLDPFAGEAVKGIVTGMLGCRYTGIEVREAQVLANRAQWDAADKRGLANVTAPLWINGSSTDLAKITGTVQYDMVFTSPPYYDLEVYEGGAKDGSTLPSYAEFMAWYGQVFAQAVAALADNRFLVVKVGNVRGKDGVYQDFVGDNVRVFQQLGLAFVNDAILVTPIGNMPVRAARSFKSGRKLTRGHQNVLVFYKGKPKAIADHFASDIEVMDPGATDGNG